ncbi:MAG: hypothetical protein ACRDRB_06655 [Pseudonocardiaceae bacterium]
MSYDLRWFRLKGLITRLPRSNSYVLTPDGQRVAIFYTKLHNRLLRPLLAAHDPPAPLALHQALRVINHHVDDYICEARMARFVVVAQARTRQTSASASISSWFLREPARHRAPLRGQRGSVGPNTPLCDCCFHGPDRVDACASGL